MQTHKKFFKRICVIPLAAMLFHLLAGCVRVNSDKLQLSGQMFDVPTNYLQSNEGLQMYTYNGELYILPCKNTVAFPNGRAFYTLGAKGLQSVNTGTAYVDGQEVTKSYVTMADNYIYYFRANETAYENLYAYDLDEQKEYFVFKGGGFLFRSGDGALYAERPYRTNTSITRYQCYLLEGHQIGPAIDSPDFSEQVKSTRNIDGTTYRMTEYGLVCDGADIYRLPKEDTLTDNFVPCESGMLLFSSAIPRKIYLANTSDESISQLLDFNFADVNDGTIAVHGKYAYISYTSADMDVTYRLCIADGTVQKLNDSFYMSMFIFDDSGVYACEENGSIYKIDTTGETREILRVSDYIGLEDWH